MLKVQLMQACITWMLQQISITQGNCDVSEKITVTDADSTYTATVKIFVKKEQRGTGYAFVIKPYIKLPIGIAITTNVDLQFIMRYGNRRDLLLPFAADVLKVQTKMEVPCTEHENFDPNLFSMAVEL
jgi:hypothetical protein